MSISKVLDMIHHLIFVKMQMGNNETKP